MPGNVFDVVLSLHYRHSVLRRRRDAAPEPNAAKLDREARDPPPALF